jgi:small GTP-binding protein
MELVVWDTAGQEDYDQLRRLSYIDADAVVICYSIEEPSSLVNVVEKWLQEVSVLYFGDVCTLMQVHQHAPGVPIVLCACKCDLRQSADYENRPLITTADCSGLAERIHARAWLETSALTGQVR